MRIVKQILVFSSVNMLTWFALGFVLWIFANQLDYKGCLVLGSTLLIMLLIGWLPAAVVTLYYRENHLKP